MLYEYPHLKADIYLLKQVTKVEFSNSEPVTINGSHERLSDCSTLVVRL